MTRTMRLPVGLLGALFLAIPATPSAAQITKADLSMPRAPAGRNSTAFDSWNKVYLVVEAGSPLTGRFLSEQGTPVTTAFAISSGTEASFTGWTSIAFGGSKSDPTFLVTYVAAEGGGAHSKYARLVRFGGGSPVVSARSFIIGVGPEWYAAEKAQTTWFGRKFIVGTRAPGGFIAQPLLHHVDLNGVVTGGQSLGDGQDYYGSPALACASTGICLATGFAGGIPHGNPNMNASYARLFSADTLQPLSGVVYLDALNGRVEEQAVVYNTSTGQFLSAWWRAGTVQTRIVGTDGSMAATRTSVPDFAGDIAVSYNNATQTILLVTKRSPADLYALELNGEGTPVDMNNLVLVTPWDGSWPEYLSAISANHATGQWLATAVQGNGGRGILVTGNGTTQPQPCSSSLSASSQSFDAFGGIGGFTLTTNAGCTWSATSDAPWLAPSSGSASGTGSRIISYSVASNHSGISRSGSITVAGRTFTVSQAPLILDPFTVRERGRADFNRDGGYDLIWQNTATGQLAAWLLDGVNLSIETGLSHNVPDLNWQIVGTGDFNGDAKPDILWRHKLYGFVAAWFMDGVTVVGAVSLSVPRVDDIGWKIAAVGDFNADGHPDIVWQHDTGPVVLWTMAGVTVVHSKVLGGQGADPRWRVAAAADINHDGHTDLLWRHEDGWLATWLMIHSDVWQAHSLDPIAEFDTAWRIVGTLDANHDGRSDILWQHVDGSVMLWAMDGLSRAYTSMVGFGTLGGPNWKVVGPK